MRTLQTHAGPFRERPFYTEKEIEQICEDALRSVSLYPTEPSPVRIERFIEKRFGITPQYETLPVGVLGYTVFSPSGVDSIFVSQELAETGSRVAERRVTTTLAHEAGHGLLHTHLFALEAPNLSLFENDPDVSSTKILCRDDGAPRPKGLRPTKAYDGRWWEVQANLTIGSLLLPRPLVEACVAPLLISRGHLGLGVLESSNRRAAVGLVARTFEVNPIVAEIRVNNLYPTSQERQLTL